MTMRFDDEVVIVTGAGQGLGREYALAFATRGASVVVNDIEAAVAASVVSEIEAAGGKAIANTHSVAERAGAQAVVAAALAQFGKLTVLINNAGIINFAAVPDIAETDWRAMQSVTLDGTFHMCAAAWPHMLESGYGRIVNTTSNAGFAGNAALGAYGAAKLAVAGFTKCAAQDAIGTGITVNAVAPMAVTRMNRDAFFGGKASEGDDWREDIAQGKVPMGPPSIVAPTVLWLAHRSTGLNGEIFSSSSGKVARVGFVVGEGYFNPDHSPEDLASHEAQIRELGDYLDPGSTGEELLVIPPLFARD
ncbi:SDR family NAD(P)-dependent oxidoreductase [Altererythrobacter indicus]|uniref:SDR family NAD(P)-dependent oxidoreductase n=1 Tax=Altericroceibacterium indicum TaxID=374177 RepID=A0A845A370_9SPHN|nr:SDR family NAD(P)-dependent oxidoreductase [Altericroceibacterium indicum]MXP24672.1 SDR family NAD(P)-dependent oxidoreductase [Altericroceibacterium indicum]